MKASSPSAPFHMQQVIEASLNCIKLQTRDKPAKLPTDFHAIYSVASSVKSATTNNEKFIPLNVSSDVNSSYWLTGSPISNIMVNIINRDRSNTDANESLFSMAMIKTHRTNGNYTRALHMLVDEFNKNNQIIDDKDISDDYCQLVDICNKSENLNFNIECAKLLKDTGHHKEKILLLTNSLSTYLQKGKNDQ